MTAHCWRTLVWVSALEARSALTRHRPFGLIGALDDLSFEVGKDFPHSLSEFRALIATVGKELL
jgi:hypothetical protein